MTLAAAGAAPSIYNTIFNIGNGTAQSQSGYTKVWVAIAIKNCDNIIILLSRTRFFFFFITLKFHSSKSSVAVAARASRKSDKI